MGLGWGRRWRLPSSSSLTRGGWRFWDEGEVEDGLFFFSILGQVEVLGLVERVEAGLFFFSILGQVEGL